MILWDPLAQNDLGFVIFSGKKKKVEKLLTFDNFCNIFFKFSMCCQGNISRQSRKFISLECSKYLYQGQGQNYYARKRTGTLGHNNFNFSLSVSSDPSHENANTALFHPDKLGLWHQINAICSEILMPSTARLYSW